MRKRFAGWRTRRRNKQDETRQGQRRSCRKQVPLLQEYPQGAFEYVVNGRSPLAWAVDQYKVKTDKDSQIVSNPNNRSISDIYYVADLIPRLVTVSVKTQEIVNSLPTSIDRIASMDSEIEKIWGVK